jgi:hypothetical protein
MDSVDALLFVVVSSLIISTIVIGVLIAPLRALLRRACDGEGQMFWQRFTILMLYLSPLIVALTFGMTPRQLIGLETLADALQRALTAALSGMFLALCGVGLRLSTLRGR